MKPFQAENIDGGFGVIQVPSLRNFLNLFFYREGSVPKNRKAVRCTTGEGANGNIWKWVCFRPFK